MYNFTILFPYSKDKKFDMKYYVETHFRKKILSSDVRPKSVSIEKGFSGPQPNSSPTYHIIAHLTFDSLEDLNKFFEKKAGELIADVAAFTDIEPIFQISECVKV